MIAGHLVAARHELRPVPAGPARRAAPEEAEAAVAAQAKPVCGLRTRSSAPLAPQARTALRKEARVETDRDHRQRRAARGGGRAARAARLLPARAARPDGHERRLRHVLVRRLHRAPRRRVGEVVHGARRPGRRPRGDDDRGPRARTASSTRCSRRSTSSTGSSAATARPGWCWRRSSLLAENPSPSEEEIRHALEGNLCRCTGYQNIVKAVQAAATA